MNPSKLYDELWANALRSGREAFGDLELSVLFLQQTGVLKEELSVNLRSSVKMNVDSDRTGAFLSGGLDSSTICGLMTELSDKPPQVFSVGFDQESYNEMRYAEIAAKHFGLDLHKVSVTADDTVDRLEEIFSAYDQPFGNSSVVPTYLCARAAKMAGADVLLAGDGGDELFAGNLRYAKQKLFEKYYLQLDR